MKPICFYHRADLDGVCSGAIVKHFVPDCELYGIDYGDIFPWEKVKPPLVPADQMPEPWASSGTNEEHESWGRTTWPKRTVYMVDVSLPAEDMKRLAEVSNLIWIDHHATIINQMAGFEIDGYQVVGAAGCELCWLWFALGQKPRFAANVLAALRDRPLPEAVRLLGSYDIFDMSYLPKEEIFWPVPGWGDLYEVSTAGTVRAKPRPVVNQTGDTGAAHPGGVLAPSLNGAGYLQVQFRRGQKVEAKQIHRLVAETFFVNPGGLDEVNHRDKDKLNNAASNLEWCSRHYNAHYQNPGAGIREVSTGKFDVRVMVNGDRQSLGSFPTYEEAKRVRDAFVESNGLLQNSRETWFWHRLVLPFQYGVRAIDNIYDPERGPWLDLFAVEVPRIQDQKIREIVRDGRMLLRYQAEVNHRAMETGAHEFQIHEVNGHWYRELWREAIVNRSLRVVACNTIVFNSQFFDGFYDPEKHDVMCAYCQLADGRWKVSLYSTKPEIDCGVICKTFGGGGHKGAAGFICDKLPWAPAS